ncbi:MAG: DUF4140 domain-containing protein, partial [Crocinitomicaceae bacterium]|nr:DUF4140 domain-containing protein [Crocinitomicaceae bacterium]
MKNILIISSFLFTAFFSSATEKEIIKSSMYEVTVYAQGAQIFNRASYTVKPGITEIIIDGVSPFIDAKSLQVKATGNVILMDSKYSLYYPKPEPASVD